MNKKSNSFTNIITVLLALLLLGIAAGPASALPLIVNDTYGIIGQVAGNEIALGNTSGNAVFNVTITEAAVGDFTNGTHYINITVPGDITINTSTMAASEVGTDNSNIVSVGTPTFNSTTRNVTVDVNISGIIYTDNFYLSFNVTAATSVATGVKTFTTYLDGVDGDAQNITVEILEPTVAGATDLYVDVDGQDSQAIALTITSTVTGDIGIGNLNITLPAGNVSFDTSATPTLVRSVAGTTTATLTKNTANELGFTIATAESTVTALFTLTGAKVNISAGTPDTSVVNFTVKTTPTGGSLVTQVYDALNITLETPNAVTIAHNLAGNSSIVGGNGILTAHASSANIADYGGWKVNFTLITAPSPLTWTTNGMNSSFGNTTLDQYEEVTTGSNGDATLNLKLSTRSSEEASNVKTNVSVQLNGTDVAAVNLGDAAITTVDSFETHVNVTSDYESAVADGIEDITFTAQLRDQFDNFVQAGGNATSTFGVDLSGNALPGATLPTAFVGGTKDFNATDTTKESVTATVTSIVIGIGPGSKIVNFVSDAYGISLSANRTSIPADGVSIVRIYAQLLDASGNPLALQDDSNLWSYSQSNLLFGTGGTIGNVNATGINTIDLTVGAVSGTDNVTVYYTNETGVLHSKKITLYATQSVSATNSVVSTTATSIKADGKTTFTVTVKDLNSQIISNAPVTFKIEDGNGTLTNAANALETASLKNSTLQVLSNVTGVVAVEFFNRNALETNSVNITVVDTGIATIVGSAPYAVTVAAANASVIVLTPASQGITNVNGSTASIAISLKDAYGNTVTDNLVVNVTNLNPTLGGLSTDSTGQITLSSGAGTVVFTVESDIVDSANIQFDAFTTYNPTLISANITANASVTTSGPTGVIVTFNNSNPVVGATVMASAQLTGEDGALSIPDKVLTFTVYKGSATSPMLVNVASTNASGIATYNFTVTEAQTYSVFAKNASLGLSNSSNIIFAGPIVSVSVAANGSSGSYSTSLNAIVTINATAKDALGNVAVGADQTVDFLVDGSSIGSDAFTNGVATITLTKAVAGTYTVLAYINSTLTATVDVTFTAEALPTLSISASPTTVTNGTAANVTFTVTSNGSAVSGATVTLSGNASGSSTTDANGSATISVTATGAGAITATASKTGYTSATASLTAQEPGVPALSISASPTTVTVGAATTVTFTVTSSGSAVSGATVTLGGVASGNSTTDANGSATISVTATGAGTITATAAKTDYTSANATVTASMPALSISASPTTVTVGAATTVTFTVTSNGSPVSNATVTLSGVATGSETTEDNGSATFSVNATGAGAITATASMTGYSSGTATVTATGPNVPVLIISATPTTVAGSTATTVTFTVTSNGSAVSGATVTLSGVATGSSTTDANGSATISVNATGAGAITATASMTGYTSGTATVTATGPNVPVLSISATPTTVTVGTATTVTFTVTSNGSAVSGAAVTLSGVATGSSTTDANGSATISVNATGNGTITATASMTGYTSGTATVAASTTGGIKGDVNGDGQVTIVDALFIAQYTVGTRTLTPAQLLLGDVNGDGQVTIVDALFIAQFTVGTRIL